MGVIKAKQSKGEMFYKYDAKIQPYVSFTTRLSLIIIVITNSG